MDWGQTVFNSIRKQNVSHFLPWKNSVSRYSELAAIALFPHVLISVSFRGKTDNVALDWGKTALVSVEKQGQEGSSRQHSSVFVLWTKYNQKVCFIARELSLFFRWNCRNSSSMQAALFRDYYYAERTQFRCSVILRLVSCSEMWISTLREVKSVMQHRIPVQANQTSNIGCVIKSRLGVGGNQTNCTEIKKRSIWSPSCTEIWEIQPTLRPNLVFREIIVCVVAQPLLAETVANRHNTTGKLG